MLGKIVARLWHTSTLSLLSSYAHSLCSTYLWLSSWTILTILPEIHPFWDLTIWENLSQFGRNMILEEGKKNWDFCLLCFQSNFFLPTKLLKKSKKEGYVNIWLLYSGKIHYTEVFDMLRSIDPPLGFGKKCPERQAYKKLIRMNMPMDKEGKVRPNQFLTHFRTPISTISFRVEKKFHFFIFQCCSTTCTLFSSIYIRVTWFCQI